MLIKIEYTEHDLRQLILDDLRKKLNTDEILEVDVSVLVKSKQNYKSEWENAAFRATIEKDI
jgi:hypothetical protein